MSGASSFPIFIDRPFCEYTMFPQWWCLLNPPSLVNRASPSQRVSHSKYVANSQARVIHQVYREILCEAADSLPTQAQQLRFVDHRDGQFFRLGQLAASRFAGHEVIRFFAHAAHHLATGRFNFGRGLVPF